jgi:hypothetical protein
MQGDIEHATQLTNNTNKHSGADANTNRHQADLRVPHTAQSLRQQQRHVIHAQAEWRLPCAP